MNASRALIKIVSLNPRALEDVNSANKNDELSIAACVLCCLGFELCCSLPDSFKVGRMTPHAVGVCHPILTVPSRGRLPSAARVSLDKARKIASDRERASLLVSTKKNIFALPMAYLIF